MHRPFACAPVGLVVAAGVVVACGSRTPLDEADGGAPPPDDAATFPADYSLPPPMDASATGDELPVPAVPATGSCAGGPYEVGVAGGDAMGLAVDGANVYWTSGPALASTGPAGPGCVFGPGPAPGQPSGAVWAVSRKGGVPSELASVVNPGGIAVDATRVYFTSASDGVYGHDMSGSLLSVPIAGGPVSTLASNLAAPDAVAVDASKVYWTNWGTPFASAVPSNEYVGGSIMSVPLAGGTPTTLAAGTSHPEGLALDASNVYFTSRDDFTVMKVPVAGGTVTTLASQQTQPSTIVVDGTTAYWVNLDGEVMSVPLAGGPPTRLALANALGLAIDAGYLYYATGGAVMKLPVGGGAATVLAAGSAAGPIAVRDGCVYWVEVDGCTTRIMTTSEE